MLARHIAPAHASVYAVLAVHGIGMSVETFVVVTSSCIRLDAVLDCHRFATASLDVLYFHPHASRSSGKCGQAVAESGSVSCRPEGSWLSSRFRCDPLPGSVYIRLYLRRRFIDLELAAFLVQDQ